MAGPGLIVKKRLLVILAVFSILTAALVIRMGWLQFVDKDMLQQKAYNQQTRGKEISARRGSILDRNGKKLAVSASVVKILVNPNQIKDMVKDKTKLPEKQEYIAGKLAEFLQLDKEKVLEKIKKNSAYEVVKSKVDVEIGEQIRKWKKDEKINGVDVVEDYKRYYPNNNLASHIIGFTRSDNVGAQGIEVAMEKYLKGEPGRILSEVDAKGIEVPFKEEKHIDPVNGYDVVLTIDETIQYFSEKALEKAIDDWKVSEGAAALVLDPRTGDILAMASKPDFNLNSPYAFPEGIEGLAGMAGLDKAAWKGNTQEDVNILQKTVWRNKALSDTYEPGSTFKAITSAAALEEKVITPDTPVNDFPVTVGGKTINCWRRGNLHGNESFREGVYNSCNPVFVRAAQLLGISKYYKYVRAFGFYDKTGIMLPGEANGFFHKNPTELNMATTAFGQRFQITPLQLISAYGAIANGGDLMKPRLVKELRDGDGNVVQTFEPEVVRQVISRETSETLRNILEGVVSEGTGKNAYVKGYRVAGKTGTSQTLQTDTTGRYIASFAAFAPADNPVVCVLVMLDHPLGVHTGGAVGASVAGGLVGDILDYMRVERRYTERDKQLMMQDVTVPDVTGKTVEEAKKELKARGLNYKIEGDGNTNDKALVNDQTPKVDVSLPQKSVVILYTGDSKKNIMVEVPNVLNKTLAEATEALSNVGLNIKVAGNATAISVRQSAEPGSLLHKGSVVEVEFRLLDTE